MIFVFLELLVFLKFSINFDNERTSYNPGVVNNKENAYIVSLLGIISLGWYGTSSNYADRVVTTSSWDVHKGGLAGIARAQEQQASDKPQAAKTAQWTGSFDFKSASNYQKGESINYRYSNAGGESSGMEGSESECLGIFYK